MRDSFFIVQNLHGQTLSSFSFSRSGRTVIIFFVSRHIKTPKATRLGEKKKIIWAKKKKKKRLSGSPQARAVLETVCSRN